MEDRITIDEKVMHGKPVIRGTRVPVEVILGSLASGMSYEEVEKEYGVRREDILAAVSYSTTKVGSFQRLGQALRLSPHLLVRGGPQLPHPMPLVKAWAKGILPPPPPSRTRNIRAMDSREACI
ncbi:MAG: hypothetical protein DSO07_04805 [Thermoproteota archaeon]|uniref:DUF433 domain-containing protein n=1 Tax=Candidatus Methanodesulfokora washburnensis TaxID=2478471 RepID=A0A520KPU8_9CREN|nr:MAG: DUF433 domain-containing protein [Candidatus Methanodesulfokores washburnensis]TDA41407.1 MAG: hypothetical protein DSO07_04805 [Candidatus Korarchaeota archaeon]